MGLALTDNERAQLSLAVAMTALLGPYGFSLVAFPLLYRDYSAESLTV
jgi:hypothetical protein